MSRRSFSKFKPAIRPQLVHLESRDVPSAVLNIQNAPAGIFPQFELTDPNPDPGGQFGMSAVFLPTGNIVVADPLDDAGGVDAGAVYLFNGTTGKLISTLLGASPGDKIGSDEIGGSSTDTIRVLANGNFVVISPKWDNGLTPDVGAVTWCNGTTGVNGVVNATNSLVGIHTSDLSGGTYNFLALPNGHFLLVNSLWDNGAVTDAGAVTWCDGTVGLTGTISEFNSLVGTRTADQVGLDGATLLTTGNVVVVSRNWSNEGIDYAGAATWMDGTKGIQGTITASNSLVGTHFGDGVGHSGITELTNGNYVVQSPYWDAGNVWNVGAATWGDGTKGVVGPISSTNSLIGSQAEDLVGYGGFFERALTNGNYVVVSQFWNNGGIVDAGAVTWGNGAKGTTGVVSASNSLIGTSNGDEIGYYSVTPLTNGNYVVSSPRWDNGAIVNAGAVTWGNGTTGSSGPVTAANSLVGSTADDIVGAGPLAALANGNYVVSSKYWDNGVIVDAGASTWGDGTFGVHGVVSAANSLVGTHDFDQLGYATALTNGNYVVISPEWDNGSIVDAGAATWGDGTKGITGPITDQNSLVGSTADDQVGSWAVTPLTNGNYVVISSDWDRGPNPDAGAVTWGNGTTGIAGAISSANSLVGSHTYDGVGGSGVYALSNGNYVVSSPGWTDGPTFYVGAITWGNGATGISGDVSPNNSLVGSTLLDLVGNIKALELDDGNFVVQSSNWDNGSNVDAGLVTWGNSTTGFGLGGPGTANVQNSIPSHFTNSLSLFLSQKNLPAAVSLYDYSSITSPGTGTQAFVLGDGRAGTGHVVVGLPDANLLTFARGGSNTIHVTPYLMTESLNAGKAVTSQATSAIHVSSPITVNNPNGNGGALTLQSQGALNLSASISTDNGPLTLIGTTITPAAGATIATGTASLILPSGNLVLNQTFVVNGGVNLSGVSLTASLTLPTTLGQSVTLIEKQPAGPIAGTFAGLAEGAILTLNGLNYTISYTGGDGNDVILTRANPGGNNPPTISDVTNQSSTGSPVGPLAFTIGDDLTAAGTLNVTRSSSNTTLLPLANIVLGGNGANRTVTVTPAAGQFGTATVTLTVTDEGGLTATDTFTLTVTVPNTPPTISDVVNQSSTGSPVGPLAFTVGDAQTSAGSLVVTRSSSNTTLLPLANIFLAGSDANRTVTVIPAAGQTGSASITLTVTDTGGLTATDTFTLTVTAPNSPPTISDVVNQSSTGSPVGPLAFTVGDTQTAAGTLSVTRSSSNTTLLPLANIVLAGSGANRTVTVTPAAGQSGTATVTLTVTDEGGLTVTDTFVLMVTAPNTLIGFKQFSVGADVGNGIVKLYNPDGTLRFSLTPFPGQPGGIRTAAGDFTGDGIADLVVGTGPGGPTHVKVFNGATQAEFFSINPFEAAFTGGVYVAAGDINGDGKADLAITPDEGGGPRIRVFTGNGFTQIADFFGIDDKNFRGGARAAIGDMNGDGNGDLVIVAGFGGGPRVAAFSGKTLTTNGGPKLFNDFFAFEQALRNGIFVAAGDVNGDGFADLVAAGGPGGGPRVFILDGKSLVQNGSSSLVPLGNFFAGDQASRGGVRVAVKNLDNDAKADVVTGAGSGAGSRVTAYLGTNITPTGTPPAFLDFDAFAGFGGGVFVG